MTQRCQSTLQRRELRGERERERERERCVCGGLENILTLHGFSQALSRLPAMFLKQPMSDVILEERTEERKTKNIPKIREAFSRCDRYNTKVKTEKKRKTQISQNVLSAQPPPLSSFTSPTACNVSDFQHTGVVSGRELEEVWASPLQ